MALTAEQKVSFEAYLAFVNVELTALVQSVADGRAIMRAAIEAHARDADIDLMLLTIKARISSIGTSIVGIT